ncbi:phospholipase [Pseudomonas sp. App30]|uniref:phospholipase D-like domain-containing protein n=1 Tax=Pseudomonas sp. App30 TaxID=3068990 RepID=UPI003A805329
MANPPIVAPAALQHTNEVSCTPRWYVQKSEYHPVPATYCPLVNGEEAFRAVHEAIAQAKKTIDIICWGFQPSMFLIRDGDAPCLGDLLRVKAKKGVRVRVLGWEMPGNSAGVAGEANLPGKGGSWDMAGQTSTFGQRNFDRKWFDSFAVVRSKAAQRVDEGIPLFVSRGFSGSERLHIADDVKNNALDPGVSEKMRLILASTVTHHQKSVLVDYELPDCAVGFVMGHNLLDEYWDTDAHTARNRGREEKLARNKGPTGDKPRQDISCRVTGPVLEHLHHNFATAWEKETGEDLLRLREAKQVGQQLYPLGSPQMVQLLRTQPQAGRRDIETLYLQAINNATDFIYIENQYFRWPPLAEAIKKAASRLVKKGSDPGLHGSLHLFVVTNVTDDGIGAGVVNTQRMLEVLGRADTIPGVTKLRRIKQATEESAIANRGADERDRVSEIRLKKTVKKINDTPDEALKIPDIPGLKVHVCSLVAQDSPSGFNWMPVYIHSKLMIVNDVFTTHGSANVNTRSMQVDSELNIAHEWAEVTKVLRRRLWGLHTSGKGMQDSPDKAFKEWQVIIDNNKSRAEDKVKSRRPVAPLVGFFYAARLLKDLD